MTKGIMARNMFKLSLITGVLLFVALAVWGVVTWKSPEPNAKGELCLHPESDNFNAHKIDLEVELHSNSGVIFNVKQINNTDKNCVNPSFPAILIQPSIEHDGWIHIVYTDAHHPDDLAHKTFVDYNPNWTYYPFYSHLRYFYDAPLWTYSLLKKPLSFWKGHAFAVKVHHHNKTIECIGGIEWGFELSKARLRPKAMYPKLLDEHAWREAGELLTETLPEYKYVYKGK